MQKELKAKIDALAKKIALLCAEKNELMIRYAEGQTDLKVGDRVTYEGAKYVWELRAIKPGCSGEPKFFGAKIKKDGTPGKDVNDIYVPYKKELVRANAKLRGEE